MEFKTTGSSERRRSGMTIAEILMAIGIGSLVLVALMSFSAFSGRSFAALANYTELEANSRKALDMLSRDLRRATTLTSFTSKRMAMVDGAGVSTVYEFNTTDKKLTRTVAGGTTEDLLTGVEWSQFRIFQRTPVGGAYEQFDASSGVLTAKVVQIDWICARSILGTRQNTESVQSAKIVLRQK